MKQEGAEGEGSGRSMCKGGPESLLQQTNSSMWSGQRVWGKKEESTAHSVVRVMNLKRTTERSQAWEWHDLEQYGKWTRSEPGLLLEFPSLKVITSAGLVNKGANATVQWTTQKPLLHYQYTRSTFLRTSLYSRVWKTELTRLMIWLVGSVPLFTGTVWLV